MHKAIVIRRSRWNRIRVDGVALLQDSLIKANITRSRRLTWRINRRYVLGSDRLNILPTWHHLTLEFARGTSMTSNSACIRIGSPDTVLGFNGPGVGSGVEKGATEFYYDSDGIVPSANKYYFLKDQAQIEYDGDTTTTRQIGGELVYVVSRDIVEGLCYVRDPILRTYEPHSSGGANAFMSDTPKNIMCTNITIRGLRATGTTNGTSGSTAWIDAGWVDGLRLENCYGRLSHVAGYRIQYCSNVVVTQCGGRELSTSTTHQGYTIQLRQCQRATISKCWALNTRYVVSLDAGCTSFTVTRVCGTNTHAAVFDIHGGDSYDGTVSYVRGSNDSSLNIPVSVQIGNSSYRRGCTEIFLQNVSVQKLALQGSVNNLVAQACNFDHIQCYSFIRTATPLLKNYPYEISIVDSTVDTTTSNHSINFIQQSGSSYWNQVNGLELNGCYIGSLAGYKLLEMPAQSGTTNVAFVFCEAVGASGSTPLNLAGLSTTFRTQGSTFHVPTSNPIASGTGLFFNNTNGGFDPSYRDPPGAAITASDVTSDYDED